MVADAPIAPGAVIGILGGGQLGRMLALAAAGLGYRVHVYCPEPAGPAAEVAAAETVAAYDDDRALARFAAAVDVVTLEFENVPAQTVRWLAARVPVRPGELALGTAQDRLAEKQAIARVGAKTAPYRAVDAAADLAPALAGIGRPAILKTRRLGYDGKGQAPLAGPDQGAEAWTRAVGGAGAHPCLLEARIDFALEVSVIVARGLDGAVAAYPAVENRHRDHILDRTIAPAPIGPETAARATAIATDLAAALDLVGVLAVEFFVGPDGGLLVNEMAPRVHNSGHWTIEGCVTSQFEQQIRAVVGLPLGDPRPRAKAVMQNLIGADVERMPELAADPAARLHIYGKREVRPGRKMGHVTRLYPLDAPWPPELVD